MRQVRNAPSSWSHCFKGAHSGKERFTFGERRETCHYERWICTPKEKHGILGQEETGGQDLKCILSVCAVVPSLVRLSLLPKEKTGPISETVWLSTTEVPAAPRCP